jgi:LPXTG-motif cell wall-anchored protein
MKKLIILSVFALGFGMSLNAQSDGFFVYNNFEQEQNRQSQNEAWGVMPSMIGHGIEYDMDANAPLGSGLLLLGGMAVLYAKRKRK